MAEVLKFEDLDLNGSYTYADYLLWKFEDRVELIKGKVFRMEETPPRRTQSVYRNLVYFLGNYFWKKTCEFYSAPFDVRLTTKDKGDNQVTTVVQPDLCVVCDPEKLDDRGCVGAPDFIIEILSLGNSTKEMRIKYDLYEESGVREYWIVKPAYEEIAQYVLEDGKYTLKNTFVGIEQEISPYIFPDLKIIWADIFA